MANKKKQVKTPKPNRLSDVCYNIGQHTGVVWAHISDAQWGIDSKDRGRVQRSLDTAGELMVDLSNMANDAEDQQGAFVTGELLFAIEAALTRAEGGFFFPKEELERDMAIIEERFHEMNISFRSGCEVPEKVGASYGGEE